MVTYMLDSNICIYVMKNYPLDLQEKIQRAGGATLRVAHRPRRANGGEISGWAQNLTAIEPFVARLDVLPLGEKAAAHYGQVRAELERAGTPCGPHDTQIGGHVRSEGLMVVTNNLRAFAHMPGVRAENWV